MELTRYSGKLLAALLVVLLAYSVTATAQTAVRIEGGAENSGQTYSWTIVNASTSAIVAVEFPHFRADTFFVPQGWKRECTHLARAGAAIKPGVCKAHVDQASAGIAPGATARFGMRLARGGALRRPGEVRVRFADGTETIVSDVELPTSQTFWERNIMGVGLSVLMVLVILHQVRRRRAQAARAATDSGADHAGADRA